MSLSFTEEQFLEVFAAYNDSLWLGAIVLWAASLAVTVASLVDRGGDGRNGWVTAVLVVHWLWAGIAYHLAYFSRINAVAPVFGALFVVQALLTAWFGYRHGPRYFSASRMWNVLGSALMAYALLYPGLVLAQGFRYPAMPTFGVPCPTVLFAVGTLLTMSPRAPWWLVVVPLIWCLIGGSSAVLFGVYPDWMLFFAGIVLVVQALMPSPGRASE